MEERFRNLDYQNWKPVRTLGGDSYGTVYEIARDDGFGMVDHAALKVLSIPAAPEDFDALVAEGRTPEEVTALFHRQVETIARQLMAKFRATSRHPSVLTTALVLRRRKFPVFPVSVLTFRAGCATFLMTRW